MTTCQNTECNYEANEKIFAEVLAKGFLDHITSNSKTNHRSLNYEVVDISNPECWSLLLDITERANAIAIKNFLNYTIKLEPFDSWLKKFSDLSFKTEEINTCKKVMERIGKLLQDKLKTNLTEYTSNPFYKSLKYDISYQKLELQVKFWVELQSKL